MKLLGMILAVTLAWGNATTSPVAEGQLGSLIARAHAQRCSGALVSDPRLVWLARYRAIDMLANGYFAHRNPWTLRRAWDYMRRVGIAYTYAAEIIAWNSYPNALAASEAFRVFMASASHRGAILSCRYTRFGVGDYKARGRKMFVVLFIRP